MNYKKAFHRIVKILMLKRGQYGIIGKGNEIKQGVLIDENSRVGNYNFIGKDSSICAAAIGNYCSIAPKVTIGPGEHPINNVSTKVSVMESAGIHIDLTRDSVNIGSDVWIGTNAVILRGVNIGTGAVIAAGAIVNKDVPEYAVVGGVPAKIIKYRFNDETIKEILESKWFENDIDDAKGKIIRLQKMITQRNIVN